MIGIYVNIAQKTVKVFPAWALVDARRYAAKLRAQVDTEGCELVHMTQGDSAEAPPMGTAFLAAAF